MMKREQKSKFINEAFVAATAGGGAIFSTLEPRDLRMAEVYFQVVEKYETEYQCELAEFRYHIFDEMVDKVLAEIDLNLLLELRSHTTDGAERISCRQKRTLQEALRLK